MVDIRRIIDLYDLHKSYGRVARELKISRNIIDQRDSAGSPVKVSNQLKKGIKTADFYDFIFSRDY